MMMMMMMMRCTRRIVFKRRLYEPMSEAEWLAVGNVWQLSVRDRWRLYGRWAALLCQERSVLIRNTSELFNRTAARLSELYADQDYQVYRPYTAKLTIKIVQWQAKRGISSPMLRPPLTHKYNKKN